MKVLILTSSFPIKEGDYYGNFLLSQAKALRDKGCKVTVLAPHSKGAMVKEKIDGVEIIRFRYFWPSLERVAYGEGIINNLRKSLWAKVQLPVFFLSFFLNAFKLALKSDIIHAHWAVPSGMIAIIVKLFLNKKVVITPQGSDLFIGSWLGKVTGFVLTRANLVIGASQYLFTEAKSLGVKKEKLVLIYNGLSDLEELLKIPIRKNTNFRLLFIGRVAKEKNLDLVLKSLPKTITYIPGVRLDIIGDGPLLENMKGLVEELAITNYVKFFGAKPKNELKSFFEKVDVVVLPQDVPGGFGLVPVEAMAAGKVMVLGRVPFADEIIKNGKNGILVKLDENSISKALGEVFNDDVWRYNLSKRARETVRDNFSMEKIAKETIKAYENISSV